MSIEELIAHHTAGAAESLAEAIENGEVKVETFPARIVPPPTPRDELVGSLFAGFQKLKKGWK